MKLLSEQSQQLDALCEHVQASDFAAASRALDVLELRPTPALIPALLPAFVPEALRRKQSEWDWLNQTHQTIQLTTRSAEETSFREKLAAILVNCLQRANASDLLNLDEACRRYTSPRWPTNHWRWLDARSVEWCLPAAADSRLALISLATFHGTGYVRERALDLLEFETSGAELPFLLVRLNDWVAPVQRKAFKAVRARIRDDYAARFARWIELLFRLREVHRNQLTDIVQWALTLVTKPVGRPFLEAMFHVEDRRLRRSSLQLAGERYTGDERSRVLRTALQDDDVGTRLWAARAALEGGLRFAEMEADPCGAIRVWALRARVEREEAASAPALRNAMFDRAASVRASARFHLSRFDPQLNVAELYRSALDESGDVDTLTCAITGLAEVGNRDDAALIAFHTTGKSVRVAKAAIRACGRLARADCTRELVEALSDSRVGVSKVARLTLANAPLAAALLTGLVQDAPHTHTRLNALALFANLERWERLIELLKAMSNDQEAVRTAAHHAIQYWLFRLGQSSHLPAPPRPEQRERLRQLIGMASDASLRGRLEQALSG